MSIFTLGNSAVVCPTDTIMLSLTQPLIASIEPSSSGASVIRAAFSKPKICYVIYVTLTNVKFSLMFLILMTDF